MMIGVHPVLLILAGAWFLFGPVPTAWIAFVMGSLGFLGSVVDNYKKGSR